MSLIILGTPTSLRAFLLLRVTEEGVTKHLKEISGDGPL
jgi:hypothetical protein